MARDNVTFKFNIDLTQMTVKGRQAVKVLDEIQRASGNASSGMTRLGNVSRGAGEQTAAAAQNFQTATQGMLNLSTAAVQTFTSISNLDRAGNRLAQSQIAVARATDLMNNKELRLNTIREQGLGNTRQATNLTNELKTARADLLVKTDKLKIEEGALFDIQLLFITNIANVMISSIQTIVSLKHANVGATIKLIVQERLLATTMFTKTVPAFGAATLEMGLMNGMTKQVINTNRLLMVGIPVIGTAIIAVSLAIQAYTENWGGFRDMIQTILPFMKDQKALLNDVNNVLGEVTESQDGFNKSLESESKLLFDLPKSLKLTAEGLAKINKEYGGDKVISMKAFNDEIERTGRLAADTGQLFPNASSNGGSAKTANSINVIPHEGDTTSTPSAINNNSLSAQIGNPDRSSVLQSFGYAPSDQKQESQIARSAFPGMTLSIVGGGPSFSQGEPQPVPAPTLESRMYNSQQSKDERLLSFISEEIIQAGTKGLYLMGQNISDELFKDRMIKDAEGQVTTEIAPPTAGRSLGMGIESFLQYHSEKSKQRLAKRALDQELKDAKHRGFNTIEEMRNFNNESRLDQIPINTFKRTLTPDNLKIFENLEKAYPNQKNLAELKSLYNTMIPKVEPGDPYFKGGRGMSAVSGQGIFFGTKQYEFIKGQLQDKNSQLYEDYNAAEIKEFEQMVWNTENTALGAAQRLTEDSILKSIDPRIVLQEDQEQYFKDLAIEKSKEDARILNEALIEAAKQTELSRVKEIATSLGYDDKGELNVSVKDIMRREKLGGGRWAMVDGVLKRVGVGIGGDILRHKQALTDEQMNTLKGYGGIVNMGTMKSYDTTIGDWWKNDNPDRIYTPEKALDAMKIRSRLEEGNLESFVGSDGRMIGGLPTDTVHDQIVKETYMNKYSPDGTMYNSQGINKGKIYNTKELNTRFKAEALAEKYKAQKTRNDKTLADNRRRNNIKDANTNRLRQGGTRVEEIPMDQEGAVVGGYTSLREYRQSVKNAYWVKVGQARTNLDFFGQGMRVVLNKNYMRSEYGRMVSTWASIQSTLSSAGLSYKTTNARYRRGQGKTQYDYVTAEWANVKSFNASQLSKANEINTLQQGFGLDQYNGSSLSLPSLQDAVAKQDELIKTIGLNRTEAFQIIDTQGRGREEIDDRVLWKNRVNNISTGTSVL